MTTEKKDIKGKRMSGKVVSTSMQDTVVVLVSEYFKHPRYRKYITTHKKYKAHDKGNLTSVGDTVTIKEVKPISKGKHFSVVREK